MDDTGAIKHYSQGDNIVVIGGKDCVARMVFENSTSAVCPGGVNEFQYIAIGNRTETGVPVNTEDELDSTSDGSCASSSVDGEMARKQVTPTFTPAATGTGTVVVLDTSSDPFDFDFSNSSDPGSAGKIMQSGVFNGPNLAVTADGECSSVGGADMFAYQDLSGDTGIQVGEGDSLSVKWTITVG